MTASSSLDRYADNDTVDFSKPHVLRTARGYGAAVAEIDALLDRGRLSREDEDRLELRKALDGVSSVV